jgi:hypothetical protein
VVAVGDLSRFQEPVWDRFFDFVFDCEEGLTRAQIREDLRRRGIDLTDARRRVRLALETAKARSKLELARANRPGILARLGQIITPEVGASLEEMKRAVSARFRGQSQLAFFRKLEAAESEQDIRSLLEDAHLLDALSEDGDVPGTRAE